MPTIIKHEAETVYINSPKASFGIFCFNEIGDLFLNSDWGMFGYAWRSMGENTTTKEFLKGCDAGYIMQKFENNYLATGGKRNLTKRQTEQVTLLIREFIKAINE